MPFRGTHAGDAPAFLVDQDRHIAAAGEIAQRVGQAQQLVLGLAIAPEQDEPGGLGAAKEAALIVGKRQSFEAIDRRLH